MFNDDRLWSALQTIAERKIALTRKIRYYNRLEEQKKKSAR